MQTGCGDPDICAGAGFAIERTPMHASINARVTSRQASCYSSKFRPRLVLYHRWLPRPRARHPPGRVNSRQRQRINDEAQRQLSAQDRAQSRAPREWCRGVRPAPHRRPGCASALPCAHDPDRRSFLRRAGGWSPAIARMRGRRPRRDSASISLVAAASPAAEILLAKASSSVAARAELRGGSRVRRAGLGKRRLRRPACRARSVSNAAASPRSAGASGAWILAARPVDGRVRVQLRDAFRHPSRLARPRREQHPRIATSATCSAPPGTSLGQAADLPLCQRPHGQCRRRRPRSPPACAGELLSEARR